MTYQYHTEPDDLQRKLFDLQKDEVAFAYFMDAGVGKSKPALDTGAYLYETDKIDAILVVADNGKHTDWAETEILKHMPPRVQAVPVAWQAGRSLPKFYAQLGDACRTFPILCVSHDTLITTNGKAMLTAFLKQRRCLMIVDESQKYKTPSAKRTRALMRFGPLAAYRRILTGSSVTKGFEDLYSQFRFLDEGIIGLRTYTEFKAEYCIIRRWDGYETIEGYRNIDQLMERLKPYLFAAKLQLDVPDPLWHEVKVPLTPTQRRVYAELRDEYLTQMDSGEVVSADLPITRMLRLSQITSGHVVSDDGDMIRIPTHRPEAARRLVRKHLPGKTIIWCAYQDDVALLMDELAEFKPCRFDGGIPHKQAMEQKALWQADPDHKVLLTTLSKGCRGYNWTEANTAIYYSYNEDFEHWVQSRARNFRRGQKGQVWYYVLVAPGTQDRKMIRTVNRKGGMADVMKDTRVFQGWLTDPDRNLPPSGIVFSQALALTVDESQGSAAS